MTRNVWVTVLLTLALAPAFAYDLSQHLWRDRLLVLVADDPQDPDLVGQLRSLNQERAAVEDRDLRIFRLFAYDGWIDQNALSKEEVAQLRRTFGVPISQRQLILVGLDGDIKRRAKLSTELSEVFAQIDAMPMRRNELRIRENR